MSLISQGIQTTEVLKATLITDLSPELAQLDITKLSLCMYLRKSTITKEKQKCNIRAEKTSTAFKGIELRYSLEFNKKPVGWRTLKKIKLPPS